MRINNILLPYHCIRCFCWELPVFSWCCFTTCMSSSVYSLLSCFRPWNTIILFCVGSSSSKTVYSTGRYLLLWDSVGEPIVGINLHPLIWITENAWSFVTGEEKSRSTPKRVQRCSCTEAAILAEIFFRIMCPFNPGQEFVSRSADMALSIIHGIVYFPTDAIIRLGDDSTHQLHHLIHGDQDLIKRSQHRHLI